MARRVFSKKNVLYLSYGLVLLCTLAYFRFPAEKFRQYAEWTIDKKMTGYTFRIGTVGFRFPDTLEFSNITITKDDSEGALPLQFTRLQLSPIFSWPITQTWRKAAISGLLGDGSFSGEFSFAAGSQRFALRNFSANALPAMPLVAAVVDRKIDGAMQILADYEADWADPYKGTGKGEITLTEGQMALLTPIFAMNALEFNAVTIQFSMESGLVNIADGVCEGKDLFAKFTGDILVAEPFNASGLQLLGDMAFTSEFLASHRREEVQVQRIMRRFQTETLPFKIGGDLNRPRITFEL